MNVQHLLYDGIADTRLFRLIHALGLWKRIGECSTYLPCVSAFLVRYTRAAGNRPVDVRLHTLACACRTFTPHLTYCSGRAFTYVWYPFGGVHRRIRTSYVVERHAHVASSSFDLKIEGRDYATH